MLCLDSLVTLGESIQSSDYSRNIHWRPESSGSSGQTTKSSKKSRAYRAIVAKVPEALAGIPR